jgi:hypothetical protein
MSFSSATIPIDSAKSVETTVLPEPVSTKNVLTKATVP